MADGTAQKCGRVGSCHIYLLKPFTIKPVTGFFIKGINGSKMQGNGKGLNNTLGICNNYSSSKWLKYLKFTS